MEAARRVLEWHEAEDPRVSRLVDALASQLADGARFSVEAAAAQAGIAPQTARPRLRRLPDDVFQEYLNRIDELLAVVQGAVEEAPGA